MQDWKLCDREQRGMILAAMVKIVEKNGKWIVPSQSGDGVRYTVDPNEHSPYCNCPDHEITGQVCKHIFAARCVRQRELFADGSEKITESVTVIQSVQRKTYPQQWPAYNRAQTTEKETFQQLLAALCEGIRETPQEGRGRRRVRLSDAVFACGFMVYSTLSGRRFISDLKNAHAKGHLSRPIHFNTIYKYLEDDRMGDV